MKNIKISFFIILLCVSSFVSANTSLRYQVQSMQGGDVLLEKIHTGTELLIEKIQNDSEYGDIIRTKIKSVLGKYEKNTDTKSQKIVIILQYLRSQIDGKLKTASTRVLQRLENIKSEKYKRISKSRVNKQKKKRYERISIKR